MRIARIINQYEVLVTAQAAEIAALKGAGGAQAAQLAEAQAKVPTADDEAAMKIAEARFAEAQA